MNMNLKHYKKLYVTTKMGANILNEKQLKSWIEEISIDINQLNKDAFDNCNMDIFGKRKNEILIQFIAATAAIEKFIKAKEE